MEKKSVVRGKLKDQEPQVPIQRYELRILQALRRIIRAVDIHSHKLTTRHKITGPQLGCLMAIKESGPVTSAKLAQKVFLSPSTIVGIIDRLEEKKLVQRSRDSKDRRLIHIYITKARGRINSRSTIAFTGHSGRCPGRTSGIGAGLHRTHLGKTCRFDGSEPYRRRSGSGNRTTSA